MAIVINGTGTIAGVSATGITTAPTNATDASKLPKAGGQMTGNITFAAGQTVGGRNIAMDGSQLDTNTSAIATNVSNISSLSSDLDDLDDAKLNLSGGTLTGNVSFGNNNEIRMGGDTDLKIYHDHANSQNVFLSTSIPTVLAVNDLKFANGANDTLLMVIKNDGKVGIGTAAPTFENGSGLEIRYAGGNGAHLKLTDNASGAGGTNGFDLYSFNTAAYIENYEAGAMVFRNNGAERMRVLADGALCINRTNMANSERLAITGNTGSQCMSLTSPVTGGYDMINIINGNGQVGKIMTDGTATSYVTSSDYRLKENVDYTWDATTRLKQLKPARFNFIADADTTVDGFLAHEVSSVVPEAISGTKDAIKDEEYEVTPAVMDGETVVTEAVMGTRSVPDYQGIDQSKLVPLLVKTIQELEARITALEA